MLKQLINILTSVLFFAKIEIFIIFSLFFILMIFELLSVSLIIPLISIVIQPEKVENYFSKFEINIGNLTQSELLFYTLIIFLLIIVIRYIFTVIIEVFLIRYTKNIEIEINNKILNFQFSDNELNILQKKKINHDFSKIILSDVPVFVSVGLVPTLIIIKNFILFLALVIFAAYATDIKSIIFLFLIISIFILVYKNIKKKINIYSIQSNEKLKVRYDKVMQFIKGFKIIKINSIKNFFIDEFKNNEKSIIKIDVFYKLLQIFPKIMIEFMLLVMFCVFIFINIDKQEQILPILGLYSFIIYRTQPMVTQIASSYVILKLKLEQINFVKEILLLIKKNITIKKFNSSIKKKKLGSKLNINNNSKITFKNISFSYLENNKQNKIFENLNLELQFNNLYGLKGSNGSGKSTFADLFSNYILPNNGSILLDDIEIKDNHDSWIENISYLDQNIFLFDDTIKNNITLDKFQNKKFDEQVYERVKSITNLQEFIKKLPNKDNTMLSGFEKDLSGGQKQKIALARCLYKRSKIIILDEPTSALDNLSVEDIKNAIKELKKNSLILLITHNQDLLNYCDHILEIKNNTLDKLK
tara:strand:+ start:499 stop:2259 length:1761 start_codon:yes stop_codon:yes gene_type:complete